MADRTRSRAVRDEQSVLRSPGESPDHDAAFICRRHDFVVVVRGDALSCRLSPGDRNVGCSTCDQASADAYRFIEDGFHG